MADVNSNELNIAHMRRRFDRAAGHFSNADFLHRTAADGLMERIAPVNLKPACIIDLGGGAGAGSRQLAKRFPRARILGLDLSAAMLRESHNARRWFSKVHEVQADARRLPFHDDSVDLVFANMLLPWAGDPAAYLGEASRVLKTDGLFAFSTLGPSSLAEIRDAWAAIDNGAHVKRFPDMHDIGDAVVRCGLVDPVLDVDYLTVTYRGVDALFADITRSGARNSLSIRRNTLTGKARFARFRNQLQCGLQDGLLNIRLELVYGHAWGSTPRQSGSESRFAAEDIGRRRR